MNYIELKTAELLNTKVIDKAIFEFHGSWDYFGNGNKNWELNSDCQEAATKVLFAPLQHELQEYLRNIYDIKLIVGEGGNDFNYTYYFFYRDSRNIYIEIDSENTFNTFEEAMEIGLLDCLNYI